MKNINNTITKFNYNNIIDNNNNKDSLLKPLINTNLIHTSDYKDHLKQLFTLVKILKSLVKVGKY